MTQLTLSMLTRAMVAALLRRGINVKKKDPVEDGRRGGEFLPVQRYVEIAIDPEFWTKPIKDVQEKELAPIADCLASAIPSHVQQTVKLKMPSRAVSAMATSWMDGLSIRGLRFTRTVWHGFVPREQEFVRFDIAYLKAA